MQHPQLPPFRYQALLIACLEYVGEDFAADIERTAVGPKTREWWAITHPMQEASIEQGIVSLSVERTVRGSSRCVVSSSMIQGISV